MYIRKSTSVHLITYLPKTFPTSTRVLASLAPHVSRNSSRKENINGSHFWRDANRSTMATGYLHIEHTPFFPTIENCPRFNPKIGIVILSTYALLQAPCSTMIDWGSRNTTALPFFANQLYSECSLFGSRNGGKAITCGTYREARSGVLKEKISNTCCYFFRYPSAKVSAIRKGFPLTHANASISWHQNFKLFQI